MENKKYISAKDTSLRADDGIGVALVPGQQE